MRSAILSWATPFVPSPRLPTSMRSLAVGASEREHRGVDQRVVEQHLGALQLAERAHRQEVRIARPGADQQHPASHSRLIRAPR
jgi:hypothetical protein